MNLRFWQHKNAGNQGLGDFGYLDNDTFYFDSACQTMRPQCVIDAERAYYEK